MIEALKSLTETNVTTKALIKGGYLAVEIGEQLEQRLNRRPKAKELAGIRKKKLPFLSKVKKL